MSSDSSFIIYFPAFNEQLIPIDLFNAKAEADSNKKIVQIKI